MRAFGHPWLLLDPLKSLVHTSPKDTSWDNEPVTCHLTEVELRQLHRRFGHPSAGRFMRVLERAGQDADFKQIRTLTRFCRECQMNGRSPGRFKFTLYDDYDFNYSVYVDVL